MNDISWRYSSGNGWSLKDAEDMERAKSLEEQKEWKSLVANAEAELTVEPISLEIYIKNVMSHGATSLEAKRALAHLRSQHKAIYVFGVGVSKV